MLPPLTPDRAHGAPVWPAEAEAGARPRTRSAEAELIRRVLEGEAGLFAALIRPCERSMFAMALSLLGNRADAEDVVQEAALKAYKSLAGFRGEASFSTWLIGITLNEAKATLRRNRRHTCQAIGAQADADDGSGVVFDVPDRRALPLELLLRKEAGRVLRRALNSLSPGYRQVLTLRDIEGLSTDETAEALCLTVANVKTRLSRARGLVRATVKQDLCVPGRC